MSKSSGKISSQHIMLPFDWSVFQRFSFLLWANRLGLRAFFHSEPLAHSPCSEQIDWSLRGYILLHNLSTPLDLLRARRVGFESFLFTDHCVHYLYMCTQWSMNRKLPEVFLTEMLNSFNHQFFSLIEDFHNIDSIIIIWQWLDNFYCFLFRKQCKQFHVHSASFRAFYKYSPQKAPR